jgi:DHA1 family tetracycline resistance protein-like MFS transporter
LYRIIFESFVSLRSKPKIMRNQNFALYFIFSAILIDVIGLGIILPVLPTLLKEMVGSDNGSAAVYAGWMMFSYAAMEFLFAPVMGNLSDKYGRKPILVASLFGFTLDYLFLAFAPNILWFFIGRIIAGMLGASYSVGTAYIADISTSENKARNFGLVGAAFGLGFIIGPFLGGVLGEYGSRVPFFAAAAISLLNCLFGLFLVPESLSKENRRKFEWRRANPLSVFIQLRRYPDLRKLIIAFFLFYVSGHAIQSTWTFFNIERFAWTEFQIGLSLGVIGLLVFIINAFLIGPIINRFGIFRAIIISSVLMGMGNLLFAFASASWMMYLFMIPYILGGICEPAIQSLISNKVPTNEQGEIQGALTGLISLSSIIAPPIMTNLFATFTGDDAPFYFPGAPFLLGALITIASTLLLLPALRKLL